MRIVKRLTAAFAFPNFRNLWLAAFTSAVGTWMQRFAQQWLILSLTGSAFFLGLDAFIGELPLLLFTLLGGVIADRYDRRKLLIASQTIQMFCALTLTGLVFFGRCSHLLHFWTVLYDWTGTSLRWPGIPIDAPLFSDTSEPT